ncbi:MAG: hypothetical protein JKX73_01710 [Flavobacteriales bacterium]|nr:hypothetical protein [Flavobacteriales bacterium]
MRTGVRKYYLGLATLFIGLLLLFFFTDLKYKVKHIVKSLLAEETGWIREDIQIGGSAYRLDLYSPELLINQIWPSMTGPASIHRFTLIPGSGPELVWMTGYSTEVMDAEMTTKLDEAYLCHNNLDYQVASYYQNWGLSDRVGVLTPRLATITQGLTDIDFPEGFGIPLMSNQQMFTATQALNLFEPELNLSMRHKISVDYLRAEETEEPIKPLYQQSVCVLIEIDTNQVDSLGNKMQMDCRPALASIAFTNIREDGAAYTGHWVVNKDRDTVSYNVTTILSLAKDTKLHYAGVHVHPYCEYLELRDLTSGEVVFESGITHDPEVMKMTNIEVYSSTEGTMMYADHQYELTCITNNVSAKEQDMMAVMLLYLHDQDMEDVIAGM